MGKETNTKSQFFISESRNDLIFFQSRRIRNGGNDKDGQDDNRDHKGGNPRLHDDFPLSPRHDRAQDPHQRNPEYGDTQHCCHRYLMDWRVMVLYSATA